MKQSLHKKPTIVVIGLKGLPGFGGAATVGENIINRLKGEFRFTVLSVETHADKGFELGDVRQIIFKKFPISKLNIFVYYIRCALYVLFCKKHDLVHLHHTDGAFILPLLKLRNRVVLTSHARPQEHVKWSNWVNCFFKINEKIAIRLADTYTAVSKPLQRTYKKHYNREIMYIPNGVDLEAAKLEVHSNNGEPYLLFAAGRIIQSKGLHILLQALRAINFTNKIKIAGNLDQVAEYKKQILELSSGLNVEFLGMIKEKSTLLKLVANAEVFVYPTLYEAMSIMLLEAASVKVPVICSDIPANTAIFSNDELTLFESENVEDLKKKIKYFYEHKDEASLKTHKAFKKLEKSHSWLGIAMQYKVVFEVLMKERS
ncbi:glycosyltransferase family 4 protein [Saccharicrinis sp. 156]|uniref:glycosyltransferase family 4 protein n=1 Tax=Saccharicrinis sp. 156 TaxID=3417574 RepID=UPI003D346943